MNYQLIIHPNRFEFKDDEIRKKWIEFATENDGRRADIVPWLPESRKQRGFFEGGVIALWAYLNDLDYTDTDILRHFHEESKKEFNAKLVMIDGKMTKVGQSTKGVLNSHCEKVIDYLEEQYGIDRKECLNPKDYKYWKDEIFPYGGAETYIEYLLEKGVKIKKGV